jgi:hypothetical protein
MKLTTRMTVGVDWGKLAAMKRRRKLELLLNDMRSLLADPARGPGDFTLTQAVWNLWDFNEEMSRDAAKMRAVLELACRVRASDCPRRQVAEERLMGYLVVLAGDRGTRLEEAGLARLPNFSGIAQAPPELQATCEVLRELRNFALACFEFKRPRDSFGGRRRALAFEILTAVGRWFDLPEVVVLAQQALGKAESVESRMAAEFLKEHLAERDLSRGDEMTEALLSLVERTHTRSTAFNALDALVETGTISESEAQERLDEWKSKHR